jgi:hypothetical protein
MTTSLQGCRNLGSRAIPGSRLEVSEDERETRAARIQIATKVSGSKEKEKDKLKHWIGD